MEGRNPHLNGGCGWCLFFWLISACELLRYRILAVLVFDLPSHRTAPGSS
jgi:hypothetical protein